MSEGRDDDLLKDVGGFGESGFLAIEFFWRLSPTC